MREQAIEVARNFLKFRESEARRAVRSVLKEGLAVERVRIERDGSVEMLMSMMLRRGHSQLQ
jgi:hypothetical protein